jgi:hypothetical protein
MRLIPRKLRLPFALLLLLLLVGAFATLSGVFSNSTTATQVRAVPEKPVEKKGCTEAHVMTYLPSYDESGQMNGYGINMDSALESGKQEGQSDTDNRQKLGISVGLCIPKGEKVAVVESLGNAKYRFLQILDVGIWKITNRQVGTLLFRPAKEAYLSFGDEANKAIIAEAANTDDFFMNRTFPFAAPVCVRSFAPSLTSFYGEDKTNCVGN